MVDIADALIGSRKIEKVIVGIRPGEKIHESLISEEEAMRTVHKGDYYENKAMLPELGSMNGEEPALKGEYSSGTEVLNAKETTALLKEHNLMVDQKVEFEGEMLR